MTLEADFQEFYRTDLGGLFTGELSMRRVGVLIDGLPTGCRTRKLFGGPGAWSEETTAIVAMGNRLEGMIYVNGSGGGKPSKVPKPPQPPEEGWADKQEDKQRRLEEWVRAHA